MAFPTFVGVLRETPVEGIVISIHNPGRIGVKYDRCRFGGKNCFEIEASPLVTSTLWLKYSEACEVAYSSFHERFGCRTGIR
jgi:hypothetical protein